jgi:hypothetical protein
MPESTKLVWAARVQLVQEHGKLTLKVHPTTEDDPVVSKRIKKFLNEMVDKLNGGEIHSQEVA